MKLDVANYLATKLDEAEALAKQDHHIPRFGTEWEGVTIINGEAFQQGENVTDEYIAWVKTFPPSPRALKDLARIAADREILALYATVEEQNLGTFSTAGRVTETYLSSRWNALRQVVEILARGYGWVKP